MADKNNPVYNQIEPSKMSAVVDQRFEGKFLLKPLKVGDSWAL